MTEWNDEIIILRLGLFHEADVWLRALSRSRGLITLFAFGGARSLHRFCGCLDKFNSLECRIKASRKGYLNLQEASLVKAPRSLRSNWKAMGIADNCISFMEALRIDSDSSNSAFSLLEGLRDLMEGLRNLPKLTTFFFRLNLASLLGFAPDLGQCAQCGSDREMNYVFIPDEGRIFCSHCSALLDAGYKRHGIHASLPVISRLNQVRFAMPSEWKEDDLSESEKRACSRLIDCFIRYHLGIGWYNGNFKPV